LGVRWRLAPSTIAIMRSIKASPGLAVMRMCSMSDCSRVPPVTAERSPPASGRAAPPRLADHRCGFAGDCTLIDQSRALDHLAVAWNRVAGFDQHHIAALEAARGHALIGPVGTATRKAARRRVALARSQRGGLRLAAAFRKAFGEIREQQRRPEPQGDREYEAGPALGAQSAAELRQP